MVDIPQMAGWPTDYPELDPKEEILLIHEDLEELKGNPKLAHSPSWLSLFAANLYELDVALDKIYDSHHLSKNLSEIRNWLKNSRIDGYSLSEIAHKTERSDYKDISLLENFLADWIQKDEIGFWQLISVLSNYLKNQ